MFTLDRLQQYISCEEVLSFELDHAQITLEKATEQFNSHPPSGKQTDIFYW